jgi:hypothetical protein
MHKAVISCLISDYSSFVVIYSYSWFYFHSQLIARYNGGDMFGSVFTSSGASTCMDALICIHAS